MFTGGHTPAHQMVYVEVPSGTAIITGDAAYLATNVKRQVPIGYFVNLEQVMAALRRIAQDGKHILPTHDPEVYTLMGLSRDGAESWHPLLSRTEATTRITPSSRGRSRRFARSRFFQTPCFDGAFAQDEQLHRAAMFEGQNGSLFGAFTDVQFQLSNKQSEVDTLRQQVSSGQKELDTLHSHMKHTRQGKPDGAQMDKKQVQADTSHVTHMASRRMHSSTSQQEDAVLETQIRELLENSPGLSGRAIAAKVQCSPTTASKWKSIIEKEVRLVAGQRGH